MTSSSSFAQLDGIEFKVLEIVQLNPSIIFKPLRLDIRDPTDILLYSEHDYSTEHKVLEWASVKQQCIIKRAKEFVNEEVRLLLEDKLKRFVASQKEMCTVADKKTDSNLLTYSALLSKSSIHDNREMMDNTISSSSTYSLGSEGTSPVQKKDENNKINKVPPPIPPRTVMYNPHTSQIYPDVCSKQVPIKSLSNQTVHNNLIKTTISKSNSNISTEDTGVVTSISNYSSDSLVLTALKNTNILQPQPVNQGSNDNKSSGTENSSQIWVDFENSNLDPFSNLELATLDDFQELRNVLESPNPVINDLSSVNAVGSSSSLNFFVNASQL